MTFTV